MTQLLQQWHILGLTIGLATFFIIGIFHPIVVKFHYYFGVGCWWWFLILGICAGAASVAVDNVMLSTLLGVLAFSAMWTVKEIFDQEKRVEKGWFPANPKRAAKKKK